MDERKPISELPTSQLTPALFRDIAEECELWSLLERAVHVYRVSEFADREMALDDVFTAADALAMLRKSREEPK